MSFVARLLNYVAADRYSCVFYRRRAVAEKKKKKNVRY